MKKILSLILAIVMLVSLCACTLNSPQNYGKLKIVATIFPQYDFARTIAKDKAQVSMLIPPGAESHSFEPTTSDILELSNCDIFIYTGGESDTWIEGILNSINNPDITVISLMDCVSADEEDISHSNDGHNHGQIDEHVWTSPVNAIKICDKICAVMCEKDSENAEEYKQNFDEYKKELTALNEAFINVTTNAKRNTLIFGDRFPLAHFAKEYNLNYEAAFSGCSDDTEASAATIAHLINKVNEENIPVVMKIELSSDNIANAISKETGAKILTFYSCHNISKEDFDSGETYLSLMKKNVETLKIALY